MLLTNMINLLSFYKQFSMITPGIEKFYGQSVQWHHKNYESIHHSSRKHWKLIQNVISQALTKSQNSIAPNPALDSGSNQTLNSSYEAN